MTTPEWQTPTVLHKEGRISTVPRIVAYELFHVYEWEGYEAYDCKGNVVPLQDDLPTEIWFVKLTVNS